MFLLEWENGLTVTRYLNLFPPPKFNAVFLPNSLSLGLSDVIAPFTHAAEESYGMTMHHWPTRFSLKPILPDLFKATVGHPYVRCLSNKSKLKCEIETPIFVFREYESERVVKTKKRNQFYMINLYSNNLFTEKTTRWKNITEICVW